MEPRKAILASSFWLVLIIFNSITLHGVKASSVTPIVGPVVEKDQRRTLIDTEYGEISSIDIKGGHRAPPYHLQFFTLEPNSVFLPVLLHVNMVFYVHTGSGKLTWADEDGTSRIDLREGDVCKLSEGSLFYIQSNLEAQRNKLRIYAMFANTDDTTYDPSIGAYSRINDLVKAFDKKIIQAAFKVPEDLIEAITNKTDTPAIVHANSKEHKTFWELEASVLRNFLGIQSNGKKVKTYNIFDKDPDFTNCHGWSLTVTKKQLKSLKGTNTGFLMVNLTTGSMLGPHWNPRATEISMVVQGKGMVRVVCGSSNNEKIEDKIEEECQNMRFKVKEGDVFVVPKFHPMAQMSFNNDSLVFLGFSTAAKENNPQFLAGKRSVLGALNRHILATTFGVSNTTIDKLFASQDDSIIFGCVSCAEEDERIMKEEMERKEEEEQKRREEEEEEKKREEEEAKKREEEEKKRKEEEARKKEEEEARKQQEEREKKREEKEARRQREEQREQEEARKQEEKRGEEEAEREQEEAKKQQEERERKKEEAARREREKERREEEEEQEQEKEQEQARRQKEAQKEQQKEAQREQEQARRQQEERERRRQEEEAKREQQRKQEEEAKREQERKQEKEAEREQEREKRGQEEEAQREQEQARKQQEEREKRREEEEAGREQERGREEEAERESKGGRKQHKRGDKGRSGGEAAAEWEQEEARRQQQEREKRREQEGGEGKVKGNRSSFEGRRVLKINYV